MHFGPMRDRDLGNLRVGDEVAAMRPGCGQQFQHIVNMPRARIQHPRHLAITPGLNDPGDLGQGQRMRKGAAIGGDSSESEHHGDTAPPAPHR